MKIPFAFDYPHDYPNTLTAKAFPSFPNPLTHIAALSGANVKYKPALVKNGTRFCNQNL
jgi:hypothetical protein